MEVHSIIEALTQEALGTTLLISTHQAEILKGMDRVVVLDTITGTDGYINTVIAASGSHEQLVESSPFYQRQFGDQPVKES
jgi:ABC-type transport system involved in cytochrome bd biosynthesis fused ATPase/permease subunit